jgi:hypothetical protein
VSKTIRDFRRAGVDKDEAARTRIKALRQALLARKQRQTPGATAVDAWDSAYRRSR